MTPIETDRILKRDVQRCNQDVEYTLHPNLDIRVEEAYTVHLHDPDLDVVYSERSHPQGTVGHITEQVDDDERNVGQQPEDGYNNIRLYLSFLIGLFTRQLEESVVESVINQLSSLIGLVNARLTRLIDLIQAYLIAQLNEVLDEWSAEQEHQVWCESLVHRSVLSSERRGESDFLRTFIEYLTGYFNRNLTTDHTKQLIEQLVMLADHRNERLIDSIRQLLRLLVVQD
jgi:hypothetical protein